jgi:type I restriction enzyme S subunit
MIKQLVPKMDSLASGGTFKEISKTNFCLLEIPLPSIEVQQEIVAEIEGYQRVIDGARQVVDNWRPQIDVDPDWPIVRLGNVCNFISKGTTPTTIGYKFETSGINFIKVESITESGQFIKEKFAYINEDCHKQFKRSVLQENDVLFSIAGTFGRVAVVSRDILPANTNQALSIIRSNNNVLYSYYLVNILKSTKIIDEINSLKVGVAQYNISLAQIGNLQIPLPPLEVQKEIVAKIEAERKIVDGCRELIVNYEEKIKRVVDGVWGE